MMYEVEPKRVQEIAHEIRMIREPFRNTIVMDQILINMELGILPHNFEMAGRALSLSNNELSEYVKSWLTPLVKGWSDQVMPALQSIDFFPTNALVDTLRTMNKEFRQHLDSPLFVRLYRDAVIQADGSSQ